MRMKRQSSTGYAQKVQLVEPVCQTKYVDLLPSIHFN